MDHELDASLSPEETSGIPELDAALGVSSNSPCMNGHAKEEGEHQGIKENTDAGVTTSIPLFLEGAEEEVSPTENVCARISFHNTLAVNIIYSTLYPFSILMSTHLRAAVMLTVFPSHW